MIIALCFTYSLSPAQLITKVEYFFDSDPGIGNGTAINLLIPSSTVDSTFTFNITGLPDGLHMVYVRSGDGFNNWSLNYSGSFIKTNGPGGALAIVKLEYYLDTDPGYGNAVDLPIQPGLTITDTFNIQVPDNGADTRYVAVRAMDSQGQWSLLYDYTVDMCALYKSRPAFSWIRFADQFSFIDSSQNNPSHKLLWKFDNLGIDSVSNPQFTFPQGNYNATLISGIGCRKDSVTVPLFNGLEKYYPDTALAGGNIVMNFYGGGLDSNVIVTLTNASTTLTPFIRLGYNMTVLNAAFDLHTAPAGIYDIHLHYPGGYDTTIISGLQIKTPPGVAGTYEPAISLSVVGPVVARPGTSVRLQLVVTNNGGMAAESVPVWFSIGMNGMGINSGYNFNMNFIPPPNSSINYIDSIPKVTGLDSLYGKPYNGQLNSFMVPYLNAGESYTLPIYVTVPTIHGDYAELNAWTGNRMFGSGMRGFWSDCAEASFDFVVGFVPIASCVNGLYNYGAYDFTPGWYGTGSVGNFGWSTAGVALSCIPGGTYAKAIGQSAQVVKVVNAAQSGASAFQNTTGSNLESCFDANNQDDLLVRTYHRVSADPNEINGPNGYATGNYINGRGRQAYRIAFENLPTATANAQRIYIADTLDKNKFDLSTFALNNFAFADTVVSIPPQRKEFTKTMDLNPGMDMLLRFNAKLDTATGILNYAFLSIDPVTKDTLPLSDIRGFLPPDIDGIAGQGSVSYTVQLKNSLVTNEVVTNTAAIVFDNNAPIITNIWLNTIDKTAPSGSVTGGTLINDTTVRLNFGGTDVGAGISKYKFYVSENNLPYVYKGMVWTDTARFTGKLNASYRFYVIPFDSVGNVAPKAPVAEYTITFSDPLPVTLMSFDAQKQQNDVLCKWQVTGQVNFSHYVVERSTDGIRYETAGTVLAQNNQGVTNYQFSDQDALTKFGQYKKLFYRLKMVDINQTARYSRIALIDLDKKYTVAVYPNPAGKEIFIQSLQYYKQLQVTDISGRVVLSETVKPGMQSINIANLTPGTYIIKLTGDDNIQTLKFIKN